MVSDSVEKSLCNWPIGVDAAVAQKRPVSTRFFLQSGVTGDDHHLLRFFACLGEDATEWVGHEGATQNSRPPDEGPS